MKYSYAFAALASVASAHTTFQSFVIDGKDQGQHFAVRTPSNGNNPILDVTSSAMVCNGGTKADDTVEVAAGSEITFQWHHNVRSHSILRLEIGTDIDTGPRHHLW